MIELPEAVNYAAQLNQTVRHKKIKQVVAAQSPHKFAWYHGDPQRYVELLLGQTIEEAYNFGGVIEFRAGAAFIAVSEGTFWRYHTDTSSLPKKHQMLIVFEDDSALSLTVRMYGGILCFKEGEVENEYYLIAKEKPSPLSDAFNRIYFDGLIEPQEMGKLSLKTFLATEQRIPGLGNGCLQDILFNAKLHPKRKVI
jgi:formamidopyrimidine-DNA glycosylase